LEAKSVSRRFPLFILLILMVFAALPAWAYGDPTGGLFFQVLMPTLAAIWGMWMVFANSIRRRAGNWLRKLRGAPADPTTNPPA